MLSEREGIWLKVIRARYGASAIRHNILASSSVVGVGVALVDGLSEVRCIRFTSNRVVLYGYK